MSNMVALIASHYTAFVIGMSVALFSNKAQGMGLCDFAERFPCDESADIRCNGHKMCRKKPAVTKPTNASLITNRPTSIKSTTEHMLTNKSVNEQLTIVQSTSRSTTDQLAAESDFNSRSLNNTSKYVTTDLQTISATSTSVCAPNMVFTNCSTCRGTCLDPLTCTRNCTEPGRCVCPDGFLMKGEDCVPLEECRCFRKGYVIPNNTTFVNNNCSEECTCHDDYLICNSSYECSINAGCRIKYGIRRCYCNNGYLGDGETCNHYADCYDALKDGHVSDGVYTILPAGWNGPPFSVYCDMATSGGGWTVFQRRIDGITDFTQDWESYKNGFGSLDHGRDFWLGNERLHNLTTQKSYKLRVDIVNKDTVSLYTEYTPFGIANESTKYRVVGTNSYTGPAGNGMGFTSGRPFSTYDQDNDDCEKTGCAEAHKGGWWYSSIHDWCTTCHGHGCGNVLFVEGCEERCSYANLNGDYKGVNGENIFWFKDHSVTYCFLIFTEMKIRPL